MLRMRFYLIRSQLNSGVDMTGLMSRHDLRHSDHGTTWARGSIDGESC